MFKSDIKRWFSISDFLVSYLYYIYTVTHILYQNFSQIMWEKATRSKNAISFSISFEIFETKIYDVEKIY